MSDERDLPQDEIDDSAALMDATDGESSQEGDAQSQDEAVASLKELVEFLVGHLVDAPEDAEVTAERRGSSVYIQLRLPEDDLGKVIGRGGRIAKAIRTVLLIAGSRHHLRVSLDIES